jgi:hypothetical protein
MFANTIPHSPLNHSPPFTPARCRQPLALLGGHQRQPAAVWLRYLGDGSAIIQTELSSTVILGYYVLVAILREHRDQPPQQLLAAWADNSVSRCRSYMKLVQRVPYMRVDDCSRLHPPPEQHLIY